MDVADEAALVQEGFILAAAISANGPDARGDVGTVDPAAKQAAVMIGDAGHGPFADEALAPVDAEMRFIVEEGDGDSG